MIEVVSTALITKPFIAFVPAILFAIGYFKFRKKSSMVAAILWTLYGLYEYSILLGISCGEDCSIRADLLIIYPVLLVTSVIAIISLFTARKKKKDETPSK
jgi:hypothetical protein